MNTNIIMTETSNTPTKRLSNEEIYDDIYFFVKYQVDQMLTRGNSCEFNFANATNYTSDILAHGPTDGWLLSLLNEDEKAFTQDMNESVYYGVDRDVADSMIANYQRYVTIYHKNYKKMIKQAGLTRDVYLQRKWEIEEKNRIEAESKADSWISEEEKESARASDASWAALSDF